MPYLMKAYESYRFKQLVQLTRDEEQKENAQHTSWAVK